MMAVLAQCVAPSAYFSSFPFSQIILREQCQFYSIKQTLIEHLVYAVLEIPTSQSCLYQSHHLLRRTKPHYVLIRPDCESCFNGCVKKCSGFQGKGILVSSGTKWFVQGG